ncbi:single-strand DNA-binding protein [Microterricola gilva]|uniref:Single-stranded DNA-binding protein n=1 Tax=Microterricola gilva TaxID=393267 RepID=A0A4V6MGI4_9MICO|nr:single-stranded DNA-binding protein [Microterricola gilva]RZU64846.1 single-strand DNA-binding protein [Microterricola gilva]
MRDSNDIITVLGVIGTDPEAKTTPSGVPLIKFRMASTQRKFDKNSSSWVDGNTNWYTVSAFRGLAANAIRSLHKGDPVIVTGRLHLRAWDTGERQGTSVDLEADVIGLDLQWGTASYQRTTRSAPLEPAQVQAQTFAAAEMPAEPSPSDTDAEPLDRWATPGQPAVLETTPF